MRALTVMDAYFKVGETLTVTGVPKPNAAHFNVNICLSEKDIALHVDARFNQLNDIRKVIFTSRQGGNWGKSNYCQSFPFEEGKEFKISIEFKSAEFLVILPDDSVFHFHNHLGAEIYPMIFVDGDVRITSFKISKPPRNQ
ncbi:beta-galactoside-binding lectin-like isoform X1 [Anabas testudineus]|uniref:Galectin n=1 Tax=Anabas testudineus TaxID=64144 RepID=A0A7N6FF86_ANATE|nr:beta-galactoside-binding lectin-like isoform X1 [Anabas testudineus]XP_026233051.1 beta-galactoside-binding lectin-like isoform X1 [Anabas testudineus]